MSEGKLGQKKIENIKEVSGAWRKMCIRDRMVHRLERVGELSKETVFLDGTKLEACANKYTFVWKKSVGKWEEKMFIKIQEAVRLVNQEFIQSFRVGTEYRVQDLRKICRFLEEICRERNIEFVHGRGKIG